MSLFNAFFRAIFDRMMGPFEGMPALVTLLPISLVFSVFALYAFKWTSDQDAMEEVKRKIHAGIFEIRLFNDDLRAIFRAQWNILGHVMNQFRLLLIPFLWMLLPAFLLLSHLNFRYGYGGFEPGDQILLTATLKGEAASYDSDRPEFVLRVPDGVNVEAGPLWIPSLNEIVWRIAPESQGSYDLQIVARDGSATGKELQVSDRVVRRSPSRSSTLLGQLWNPAEAPLESDSPFTEISIDYPGQDVSFFGFELNWVIGFLLISVIVAFALRGPLGVTF